MADDTPLMLGNIFVALRSLFQPHILFIFLSVVLLLVPTPLDLFKSSKTDNSKNAYIIEETPFVVLPEPGENSKAQLKIIVQQ